MVLEDDFQFPLYGKELDHYDIREAGVLREAAETEILQELLPKRAKLCAMHFLQNSDRTEEQVRRKLRTLFYPEDIITLAVSYVKQYHYIDDVRYAANYIEYRSDSKSMRQLEQELYQKGISKEDIEAAKQQIDCPDEAVQIRNWLKKKGYSSEQADRRETERIYRFLARRGYSITAIQREIRNFD